MKHLFTVFTPTHNRAHLIHKLYESLKRQTFKDFVWLVVDDGSDDNTKEVIDGFIKENKIEIVYHFIPNGFLYLAESYSATVVDSNYIVRIDDDDWLLDNCLEVYYNEWKKIESEGITDIGEIRALSVREDGSIPGNYNVLINSEPIDTTFRDHQLQGKSLENNACRKVEVWKKLFYDDDIKKWLFDKVNYVTDSLMWFRLSEICRTRYIFVPVRVYYDNPVSIMHKNLSSKQQHYYNHVYNGYMMLNEFHKYFFKNPKYFLFYLCAFGVSGHMLKLNYRQLCNALTSKCVKLLFIILTPLFFLYSLYLRQTKK